MRVTIESSETVVSLRGAPCRVWLGETEAGAKVCCFVVGVACDDEGAVRELQVSPQTICWDENSSGEVPSVNVRYV